MRRRLRAKTRCANPCEIPRARRRSGRRSATLAYRGGALPGYGSMRSRTARSRSASGPPTNTGSRPCAPSDVAPRSDMRINRRPIRERAVTPGMPRDGLDRRAHRPGSCSREARETQLPHGRARLHAGVLAHARPHTAKTLTCDWAPPHGGTSRTRARSHRAMRTRARARLRACMRHTGARSRAPSWTGARTHTPARARPLRDQARTGRRTMRPRRGWVRIGTSRARWADARSRSRHAREGARALSVPARAKAR